MRPTYRLETRREIDFARTARDQRRLRGGPEITESRALRLATGADSRIARNSYRVCMIDRSPIRERFAALSPHPSEHDRRLLAVREARAAGYGGIAALSAATGAIGRGFSHQANRWRPALHEFC